MNAKQYHRILKRRAARAKLEEMNRMAKIRKVLLSRDQLLLAHLSFIILFEYVVDNVFGC